VSFAPKLHLTKAGPLSFTALLFILCAALPQAAGAEEGFTDMQKRFVRRLFSEQRYFDAIAETKRLRSGTRDTGKARDYDFFIDINYFLGGQYRSVVQRIASRPGPDDFRSNVLLSQAYLGLGMCGRSLDALRGFRYDMVEPRLRFRLLARRADAFLAGGRYRELADEVAAAEPYVPEREQLDLIRSETGRHAAMPRVSVPLATALSVFIPGAGQMYAGNYIAGIVSFIGVAALAGGAALFYRSGQRELAYTFIFFSSVFYLGNIYGAFNTATAANEDRESGFREAFRKKCLPAYDPRGEVRDNEVFKTTRQSRER
jgi:hypothetical protein